MAPRYGPRESDRREAFSDEGRLQCDVKVATFATRQRGRFGQACMRSCAAQLVHAIRGESGNLLGVCPLRSCCLPAPSGILLPSQAKYHNKHFGVSTLA